MSPGAEHSTAASAVRLVHCCRSCAHSAQLVARTVHVVHCCGSSACGARLVAQRCVVCTAVVAVRQLHSWPRPGAFWALLLDHLKSCENPTSSAAVWRSTTSAGSTFARLQASWDECRQFSRSFAATTTELDCAGDLLPSWIVPLHVLIRNEMFSLFVSRLLLLLRPNQRCCLHRGGGNLTVEP